MGKKAIVFDNSGTLIERYRVIKDLSTGELITHINSLDLIDELETAALVVLQFNTNCLKKLSRDTKIRDLILNYNIDFDISYSSVHISDEDVKDILNDDPATIKDITDGFPLLKEKVPDMELCNGSAIIIDFDKHSIAYTISSAGHLFPNVIDTVDKLQNEGIDVFIASGDRSGAIQKLSKIINIPPEHGFATASTKRKANIVSNLKDKGYKVMMVGDGPNDILAFNEADVSVLTTEQKEDGSDNNLKDSADFVIDEISQVLDIDF